MNALILARSVEEAASSSRRGFWWEEDELEGGGALYNLRLGLPPRWSAMAVAEERVENTGEDGERDHR